MKKLAAFLTSTMITAPAAGAEEQTSGRIAPPEVYQVAPALGEYTDNVLFGEVWRRDQLAPRDRSIVTVSALIAQGKIPQVGSHVGRALDNGVKPVEIGEIITQFAFYSGWPNAISAVYETKEVFDERGIGAVDIVLRVDCLLCLNKVQRGLADLYHGKRPDRRRCRKIQNLAQKLSGAVPVARGDDRVVEMNGHGPVPNILSWERPPVAAGTTNPHPRGDVLFLGSDGVGIDSGRLNVSRWQEEENSRLPFWPNRHVEDTVVRFMPSVFFAL